MSKSKAIITAIIAVVVIGGGIFYFTNKDKKTDTSSNSADTSQSTQAADNTVAKKFTDACKVFTKEEIGAALGGTFGEGKEGIAITTANPGTPEYDNDDLRGSSCNFDQDDDGTTASMTQSIRLSVDINTFATVDEADSYMQQLHGNQTIDGEEALKAPVDVDGVGDQAFFVRASSGGGDNNLENQVLSLNVRIGRQIVNLTATQLSGIDQDTMQAGLKTLGQKL